MKYKIAETKTFLKKIDQPEIRRIYLKIIDFVYPVLRQNPFFGPNIKRLKGSYSEFHRYRIGNYRLFYRISDDSEIIYIVDIVHRHKAYE